MSLFKASLAIITGMICAIAFDSLFAQTPTQPAQPARAPMMLPLAGARPMSAWPFAGIAAQNPDPAPSRDYEYKCVSANGGPDMTFHFMQFPFQSISAIMTGAPVSSDVTPPVISSVVYSNGGNVLNGDVKIVASLNGMPFTITAIDGVGVQYWSLYVDGYLATSGAGGNDILPSAFYVRWNAKTVSLGAHLFKLVVFDAAGNSAQKTWSMIR